MCRDLKLVEVADQKCKFFCIKKLGVVIAVVNRRSRKSELDEQNKRKNPSSFMFHYWKAATDYYYMPLFKN